MGQSGRRGPGGIRTFALVSLLGGITQYVGGETLTTAFALTIGATTVVRYWRRSDRRTGITSEVALLVAFLLGVLAQQSPALASGLGVTVTILLATRTSLHRFVSQVLTDQEAHDALLLAAAAVVLLPLLPNRTIDPFDVLNPFAVWRLAVLMMAISSCGYIGNRLVGPRHGVTLAGLAGGFVSSVATIGSMGGLARERSDLERVAVAGAVLSSVATVVQLMAVVAVADRTMVVPLLLPLTIAGVVAAVAGGAAWWRAASTVPGERRPGRAFNPQLTFITAVTIAGVTLLSAVIAKAAGPAGISLAAGLGGFADVHASAIGAVSLVGGAQLTTEQAGMAVLIAFSTNATSKMVTAFFAGGARFGSRLLAIHLVMVAGAWLGWLL